MGAEDQWPQRFSTEPIWVPCPFAQWQGTLSHLIHRARMCDDDLVKCPLQLLGRWHFQPEITFQKSNTVIKSPHCHRTDHNIQVLFVTGECHIRLNFDQVWKANGKDLPRCQCRGSRDPIRCFWARSWPCSSCPRVSRHHFLQLNVWQCCGWDASASPELIGHRLMSRWYFKWTILSRKRAWDEIFDSLLSRSSSLAALGGN